MTPRTVQALLVLRKCNGLYSAILAAKYQKMRKLKDPHYLQLYLALFYVSKCKKLKPFLFANQFLS